MATVRTRFAPSPTGFLHVGGLRTALYSYAYARANNGQFVLRVEDTDRNRYVEGATEAIYKVLKIFGLNWDEHYVQSERVGSGIYKESAEKLLKEGRAYRCFCKALTKEEINAAHDDKKAMMRDPCRNLSEAEVEKKLKESGGKCAIRLKVPDEGSISFHDIVLNKEVTWDLKFVDDAMLLKTDGFPTYHLGVVVDDSEMKVSHILRAMEWLPSTPIHLLLFKYLGLDLPNIGHMTDILDPTGGKLSKRKGNVSCEQHLAEGYLPEAVLNFIMLLGWAPKNDQEFFTLEEFVKAFSIEGLNRANPVFNRDKLLWFNKQYLMRLGNKEFVEEFKKWLTEFATDEVKTEYGEVIKGIGAKPKTLESAIPLIKERVGTLSDVLAMVKFLFVDDLKIDSAAFKDIKSAPEKEDVVKGLEALLEAFRTKWKGHEDWENRVRAAADKIGWKHGDLFMALRIAIVGSRISPPLDASMDLLGYDKSIDRIKDARARL